MSVSPSTDLYTLHNALAGDLSQTHWQAYQENNSIYHWIMGNFESIPILGRIIALFEVTIIQALSCCCYEEEATIEELAIADAAPPLPPPVEPREPLPTAILNLIGEYCITNEVLQNDVVQQDQLVAYIAGLGLTHARINAPDSYGAHYCLANLAVHAPNLTSLSITYMPLSPIAEDVRDILELITKLTHLEDINITFHISDFVENWCEIRENGIYSCALGSLFCLPRLSKLTYTGRLPAGFARTINRFVTKDPNNGQKLRLFLSNVTQDALKFLPKNTQLAMFHLYQHIANDNTINHLMQFNNIDHLTFEIWAPYKNFFTSSVISQLSEPKKLSVKDSDGSDNDTYFLSRLPNLILYEAEDNITDKGLFYLSFCKRIETLSLYESPITDNGLYFISLMTHLKALSLISIPITDDKLHYLTNLTLESLCLDDTQVTNRGLSTLAQIGSLTKLSICATPIDEDGIPTLERMHSLKALWTSIESPRFDAFKAANPQIKFKPFFVH